MRPRRNATRLPVVAAVLGLLVVAACDEGSDVVRGSGTIVTDARDVEGFRELRLEGSGEVRVDVGERESLTIEADDNLLELISSEVRGSRLVIVHDEPMRPSTPIVHRIEAIDFDGVTVLGGADVTVSDLDCGTFSVSIAGSGSFELTGTCDALVVEVAGSGDLDASALAVTRADVSIAGSGDVIVDASDELRVSIAGSGDVVYLGDPATDIDIRGSGEVRRGP